DRCEVFGSPVITEQIWDLIRTFAAHLDRHDIRLRFGGQVDLSDEPILRRLFGPGGGCEIGWVLDGQGAMAGISHRVAIWASEAEVALLVRSDLKRRGAGRRMLQEIISKCRRERVARLTGIVLSDNKEMIRIARRAGFTARGSCGLTMKLELTLPE